MLQTLATGVCLVLTLAACATPTPPRGFEPGKETARAAAPRVGCVAMTGTHIVVSQESCSGFGTSYSRDDLARTGAADTAQALRQVDPALTLRKH
jgi:hypothetical protein